MITLSGPSWTDAGGFWIALGALLASFAALGVSIWSARSGHKSAVHAGTSAKAAEAAADSSAVAARAAEKSADADGQVARVELDRDHEAYRPKMPGAEAFRVQASTLGGDPQLVYEFTPDRTYRILAEAVYRAGTPNPMEISTGLLCRSGIPVKLVFEGLPDGKQRSDFSVLRFSFWPPSSVDHVEHWTCRCGGDLESRETPHWETDVPVGHPKGWPYDIMNSIH